MGVPGCTGQPTIYPWQIYSQWETLSKEKKKAKQCQRSNIQSYGLHMHTQHKNYVHADIHAYTNKNATKFGDE